MTTDGDGPPEDVETRRFTMTMTEAQIERLDEFFDEGMSLQERVRMAVSQSIMERERHREGSSREYELSEALMKAIRRVLPVDERGRIRVALGDVSSDGEQEADE